VVVTRRLWWISGLLKNRCLIPACGFYEYLRFAGSNVGPCHSDSRQPQTLERGASRSSIDVRHDNQFENGDIRELNVIFLNLAYGIRGTEIPLLAHNFSKRAPTIWGPSQDELLGTLCLGFLKDEGDASKPLRLIED
jgi:hypothetical protein